MIRPLVSVVIPCYNYAEYLPEAVESVIHQDYDPVEIIVVDDGSSDGTDIVAHRLMKKYEQIIYIKQPNGGPSSARNAGLEKVRGEFVVCLDADDKLAKQYIKYCLAELEKDKSVGYIYTQMQLFGAKHEFTEYPEFNIDSLRRDNFIHISAFFRRSALADLRYDVRLRNGYEDWDLYLSLAERKTYGVLVDRPLLLYRKHDSGINSITDAMNLRQNGFHTKLLIQVKHAQFVGVKILLQTLRLSLRHDVARLKTKLKSIFNRQDKGQ